MKLITIILLINWLLCNTINAQTCRDPIVILNQKIPQTIDFVKLGFGKGLNSDKTIIIVGTPTNQTDQFAINLAEEGELFKTANVPFHFNPRFGYEQVVVRNSWNKTSGWGTEERSGGFPFAIGQTFVLKLSIISARIPGISININNKFFVSYRRYRFYDITQLNIVGAIQLSSITLCNPPLPRPPCLFQYVFANPEIPVNYNFLTIGSNFGTGFLPPKKITIIGTPTNNTYEPNDFVINMGENGIMLNNATVVFSYNPRFDVNQVIRNTWTVKDGWGIEESFGWFPFTIGKTFKMEIIAAKNNTINVNVDNNLLSFSRLDLSKVTQIEISKAIEVASVVFCN